MQDVAIYGMDPFVKLNQNKKQELITERGSNQQQKSKITQRLNQTTTEGEADPEFDPKLLESPYKDQNLQKRSTLRQNAPVGIQSQSNLILSRPKTSNNHLSALKRQQTQKYEKFNQSVPKNIIDQCEPTIRQQQAFLQKKVVVSALEKHYAGNGDIIGQNEYKTNASSIQQLIQSLYRIKIPQQILSILQKYVQTAMVSNMSTLSQEIMKNTEIHNSTRGLDLNSTRRNLNVEEDQLTQLSEEKEKPPQDIQIKNAAKQPNEVFSIPSHELQFNLKLTDLSDMENPFVIYENRPVDCEGFLIFDNFDKSILNPIKTFPWLHNMKDIEKRTLKIEVTYESELVLLRFIHLDQFYPIKYPQIMLEITNNMIQNQILLEKQSHIGKKDSTQGVLIMKRVEYPETAKVLQNERVKSQTGSALGSRHDNEQQILENTFVVGENSIDQIQGEFYYALKPSITSTFKMLDDIKNYRIHLKDVPNELFKNKIEIQPSSFKDLKIIIEYNDCIIQSKNIIEYNMLRDDNKQRQYQAQLASQVELHSPFSKSGNRQAQIPILTGLKLEDKTQRQIRVNQQQQNPYSNNLHNRPKSQLEPKSLSLIQKYGQNKSLQYYIRKEREDQATENRKRLQMRTPEAAIGMKDNRKVFRHLNNTAFQTKPMAFNIHELKSNKSQINSEKQFYLKNLPGKEDTMNMSNTLYDIPEGFKSLISTKGGDYGFYMMKPELHEQNQYMNFPYSRSDLHIQAALTFAGQGITISNTQNSFLYKANYYKSKRNVQNNSNLFEQKGNSSPKQRPLTQEKGVGDNSIRNNLNAMNSSFKNTISTTFDGSKNIYVIQGSTILK